MPSAIIFGNAKEMILGVFKKKLKEASCHLRPTEPFKSWSYATKREIKEIKKASCSGRKFIKSSTSKRIWDDCLEHESYIRSNTAHGVYKLYGEFHETIITIKTSDISKFCELEWFE